MLPSVCNMPELSSLEILRNTNLLNDFFGGQSSLSDNAVVARRALVRLVDRAVSEYGLAKNAILNQIVEVNRSADEMANGRTIYMFDFSDHLESCVTAINRATALLSRLRHEPSAPQQNREMRRTNQASADTVRAIRNVIDHIEEAIFKSEVGKGKPIFLAYGADELSAELGDLSISFSSLASLIISTHHEAKNLIGL
jgi:hypothetical protein